MEPAQPRSPADDDSPPGSEGGEARPFLSVVIPAYNELATIEEILRRVRAEPHEKEIIVVDDGSTDGTAEAVERLTGSGLKLLRHQRNRGKGAAVRTGIAEARGSVILIQDADLEYQPSDYEELLRPIMDGDADVVYGSRFLGGPHRVLFFWHYAANRFLTLLSNVLSNLNLSDMETCYKAFRREVLADLSLKEDRFGFEPEITQKVSRRRWRIYEVPVSYRGRTYEEGKKIGARDALRALWCILRYAFFD